MPHTKAQKRISWEVLDKYKTSRGLAAFLRKRKIKGLRNSFSECPLAEATGWKVSGMSRVPKNFSIFDFAHQIPLTPAERDFVAEFDLHVYPDLERK